MSFTAKYHGRCFECGENLYGQQVRFTDDEKLVHDDCDALPDTESKTGEVCDRCFVVKSLTGECPTCD